MDTVKNLTVKNSKLIVVKIGSSLLMGDLQVLQRQWLDSVCDDIFEIQKRGQSIVIVTSGAISVGMEPLGLSKKSLRLEEKQAAAAAGQIRLSQSYQSSLDRYGLNVAQVLLTRGDTEDRRRYLNARETLSTLIKLNAIPLINENDTVATEEIRFGDNDQLAARVASMIGADLCILLSDVDGLYTKDPLLYDDAKHIPVVNEINDDLSSMAGESKSKYGTGGMQTKLLAAEICMDAGCHMIIANGKEKNPIKLLETDNKCTWFVSGSEPRAARKQWISSNFISGNRLIIDEGAFDAIKKGNSLLPAGILFVEGDFKRGDTVEIIHQNGNVLGRGLIALSSSDAKLVMGKKSEKIEEILGYKGRSEIIHRDDMVIDQN